MFQDGARLNLTVHLTTHGRSVSVQETLEFTHWLKNRIRRKYLDSERSVTTKLRLSRHTAWGMKEDKAMKAVKQTRDCSTRIKKTKFGWWRWWQCRLLSPVWHRVEWRIRCPVPGATPCRLDLTISCVTSCKMKIIFPYETSCSLKIAFSCVMLCHL